MKKWTLAFASLLLILFFQNCQKATQVTDQANAASAGALPSATEFKKTSAQGVSVLQLWDYDHARTLDLDLATGKMAVFLNYGSDRGEDLCLSEAERQEAKTLLSNSEVCEPVVSNDQKDQQCIQIYKYPYAVLIEQGQEIRLGEKTSGCDIPVDLCGNQAQSLKDFVQHVLATLDQKTCR